jgi:hypothetical protein
MVLEIVNTCMDAIQQMPYTFEHSVSIEGHNTFLFMYYD